MKNEELEAYKKEYEEIKKALSTNFKELEDPNITMERYRYLENLKKYHTYGDFNDEYGINNYLICHIDFPEETNGIYVYTFEQTIGWFEEIWGSDLSYLNKDKTKKVIYYVDIENCSKYELVLKENQKEFESSHNVITGKPNIYDAGDRYNNARNQFLDLCIKEGQEKATKLILEKYPKRNI